ncbi:hypothetical protein TRFO_27712 [Tritrichomonas foetus]|uniref:Ral GTPase-activating protein subunit alpha/beta N-terminal domain-containing protein n=1 Tax=Tritrichomonas foetus TaxID=1144522 RepID=A0A1J4K5G1_9EUKA|nr:hypothetical protein TRFO_27712 [Tritrichomonas foetus]|eukprot:OHT04709.1 hypothetical protein TRFO_27712 [Tritrichomonas foetus]
MSTETVQLILNHLYECEVLDRATAEEDILTILSSDAAATIATTTVSCFCPNGFLNDLSSPKRIDWFFQTVSYCLTLPTLFEESLFKSLTIFRFWLTRENFFPTVEIRNEYARRIFTHLTCIFDFSKDDTFPDVREKLVLLLINDYNKYQTEQGKWFDEETYNVLIRVLLGSADHLSSENAINYFTEESQKKIIAEIYHVLFSSICNSNLKNDIWDVFTKFCIKWSSSKSFVSAWRKFILKLFENLLDSLINQKSNPNAGFHLQKFIHALDFNVIYGKEELFAELGKTLNNLTKKCIEACRKTKSDYVPMFPIETFFGLFGSFIFKSFETNEMNSYHARILKSLFRMSENFYIPKNSKWNGLLMAIFRKSIFSNNPQVKESVLMHCVHLLNNRNRLGLTVLNDLMTQIEQFKETDQIRNTRFWLNYSVALTELSEFKPLSKDTLTLCFEKATDLFTKFNILNIEIRYNMDLFVKHFIHLYQTDYLSVSSLNLFLASMLPFIQVKNISELLPKMLQTVSDNKNVNVAVFTFIILIAQLTKYNNAIYETTFAKLLIEFLVMLNEEQPHEKLHSRYMSKIICGRSVNNKKKIKPIKTYLIGDLALFSFNENELEVRDSRGRFLWDLTPLYQEKKFGDYNGEIRSDNISDIQPDNKFDSKYESPFPELQETIDKIQKINEDTKIDHSTKIFLQHQFLHGSKRNKFVNFLIESGLYQNIKQIDGDESKILEEFDSIPDVKLFQIPVFHYSENGLTNFKSPLFERFLSLMNGGQKVDLGLIAVTFKDEIDQHMNENALVSVIFNETPFELSNEAANSPKAKLVIIVQPFDETRFLIEAKCKQARFWCNFLQKRLVSKQQLMMTICATLFNYIAATTQAALFATEDDRNNFIKEIKGTPISVLDIVKDDLFSVQ